MHLDSDLTFDNKTIGDIKLATMNDEVIYQKYGHLVNISGFGRCEYHNDYCDLRFVEVPLFNFTQCHDIYQKADEIDDVTHNMTCVGNVLMKFFPQGDSGGETQKNCS